MFKGSFKFLIKWKVLAVVTFCISMNEIYKGDYSEAMAWFLLALFETKVAIEEMAEKIGPFDWC